VAALTPILTAQTRIDLPTQAKRIDFAQASSTRPVKTDTTLPALCSVGELFFESDAEAGSNLYGCTSTNVWTSLGAPFSGMVTTLGDLRVRRESATLITIGGECSTANRCNVRHNDTVFTFVDEARVTSPSGTGTVWIGVTETGTRTAWHDLPALTCSGLTCVAGMLAMPPDVTPISRCTVSTGSFDLDGCSDLRAIFGRDVVKAGNGLTRSGDTLSLSVAIPVFNAGITAPPPTCTTGEKYLRADTNQSFECSSTDTWVETSNVSLSLAADPEAPAIGRIWHNSTEDSLKARLNAATTFLVQAAAMAVAGAGAYPARVTGAHTVDAVAEGRWNRQSAGEFESGSIEAGGWMRLAGNGSGASSLGFFDSAASSAVPVYEFTGGGGSLTLARYSGITAIPGLYLKSSTGAMSVGQTACDPDASGWSLLVRDCSSNTPQTRFVVQAAEGQSAADPALAVQQSHANPGGGATAWASSFAGQVVRYGNEDTAGIGQAYLKSEVVLAEQTGDAAAATLLAADPANAGTFRICAVASVKTTDASVLTLLVTFRSPASASDLTKNLLDAVSMSATTEHDACMTIRSTGEAAVTVDPSDISAAAADIRIYTERLGLQ